MNPNSRFLIKQAATASDDGIEPISVQSGWQRLAQPMGQAVQAGATQLAPAAQEVGAMVQQDAMAEIREKLLKGEPLTQEQLQMIQQKLK